MPDFELRIIRLDWAGENDLRGVYTAERSIKLDQIGSDRFEAVVPAYPDLGDGRSGQLAISTSIHEPPPVFEKPDGSNVPLTVVNGSGGKTWWVEKGEWENLNSGSSGYHDAPTCRHAGWVTLRAASQTCEIRFSAPGFDAEEFTTLLDDFRGQCWRLISDTESYTTVPQEIEAGVPNKSFIDEVREICKSIRNALKSPHSELEEIREQKPVGKAKPTPQTYRDMATKGWTRKVTSRGHRRNYDTEENRYLATIVQHLRRMVNLSLQFSKGRRKRLDRQVERVKQQIDRIERAKLRSDPDRLENFAAREKKKHQLWLERACELFNISHDTLETPLKEIQGEAKWISFSPTGETNYEHNSITANVYSGSKEGLKRLSQKDKVYIQFPHSLSDLNFFSIKSRYFIAGKFNVYSEDKWARCKVRYITYTKILNSHRLKESLRLKKKAEKIKEGENKFSTNQDFRERQEESRGLEERQDVYRRLKNQWSLQMKELEGLQQELTNLLKNFEDRGVTRRWDTPYPGSMVFVEESSYRKSHTLYTNLTKDIGPEGDLFDQILSIEDLGIINLPMVYERWCLLRYVRVLESEYGFKGYTFENGQYTDYSEWKEDLVKSVCKSKNVSHSISFHSSQIDRQVRLTYHAKLENPHSENPLRPDFLLEVKSGDQSWEEASRVVLDAKFKQYGSSGEGDSSFAQEIENLVRKKDYAENHIGRDNHVFVIHPHEGAVKDPTGFQSWAGDSYYGGDIAFEWQDSFPDHHHGGVLLRPSRPDDIKRLLAMVLMYSVENNSGVYKDTLSELDSSLFCPICGNDKFEDIPSKSKGKWKVCRNNSCRHFMILHWCESCGNRLWKHGSYWTFHDEHPESPYNIKCPSCGSYYMEK